MVIDEKGKLFGKISIIDLLVIVVFIAAVIGCGYKFLGGSDTVKVSASNPFTVVFRVDGVKSFLADSIEEGEVVYEKNGGKIGTVTGVRTESYKALVDGKESEYLTYDNRDTVYITVEAKGNVTDKGFYSAGNRQIYTGGSMNIQSRLFTCGVTVESVTK